MSLKPRLILASGSAGRKAMLTNAGLQFEAIPADIDEAEITKKLQKTNASPKKITLELAKKKALYVSKQNPQALVIGSDQTLVLDNKIFSKAKDKTDAINKLIELKGKKHTLNSSVCISFNKKIIWKTIANAQLTMHDFNHDFLNAYADRAQDALTSCVGAYKIEGEGAWLFSEIKGDVFTIMGMPLLPLLAYLHKEHGITP